MISFIPECPLLIELYEPLIYAQPTISVRTTYLRYQSKLLVLKDSLG